MHPDFIVRESLVADAGALVELLSTLIRIGGTTAHEEPYTAQTFKHIYLAGDALITSVTAEDQTGKLLGFQSVSKNPALPDNLGDVGTFVHTDYVNKGIGTALFKKTRGLTTTLNLEALHATIRADNIGGLAYYDKMGFINYDHQPAVPLKDGTKVDRISKRFLLKWY